MNVFNSSPSLDSPKKTKRGAFLLSLVAGLFTSSVALADDISVYGSAVSKPQILFTLDYSQSMDRNVDGRTRIEILRETVVELMDNYQSQIEFGIGPMFAATGGGVQWPVSDLRLDASNIDPNIPAGQATGLDVVTDIIEKTQLNWGTATIPALAESAQYFRGGPVTFGGVDTPHTLGYKPLEWDVNNSTFKQFNNLSGSSAAYTPANAYSEGTAPGSIGYCRLGTNNNASNTRRIPSDCRQLPVGTTYGNCVSPPASHVGFPHYINRDAKFGFQVCEYRHSDRRVPATYKSPIKNQCQASAIILISDGAPINSIPDYMSQEILGHGYDGCPDSLIEQGNCGPEIAQEIANNNQVPSVPNSTVVTHTVGFALDGKGADWLETVADAGDGEYFSARNGDELFSAIDELISDLIPETQQFSNFSVDVDRASFSHDNRAYLPLFQPSDSKSWNGNIKGYFIGEDGLEDIDGREALETVGTVTQFADTSRSFWSAEADGNDVTKGGVSGNFDPANRNLYTLVSDNPNNTTLYNSKQTELSVDNPQLKPNLFGFPNQVNVPDLLQWIREQPMGEPLHSNNVIANYENDQRVIFAMTNQGFLHAIDASLPVAQGEYGGGEELFAFMPVSLLSNIHYMRNGGFTGEHIYGLDGSITPWHIDENNDGIVNGNDTLTIIFGMRRGGQHYYAMDVTDPNKPVLAWQINPTNNSGFGKLAQTWSEPQIVTVKDGNKTEDVLVFGGGYDDSVDDIHQATASNGNSIFMVDNKGRLIWSASHPDMKYGIPSDVRVIDSDEDSVADRMYVGDLGGQVWRVDFDDVNVSSQFKVTKFADLAGGTHQPFFYPPSVSRERGSDRLLVSIGSGNRDNPIRDRTRARIYTMFDDSPEVGAPGNGFSTARESDLVDVSQQAFASAGELANSKGWFIQLNAGEKSLSPLVTINGDLMWTTFEPTVDANHDVCEVPTAVKRLYALDVGNAGAPNSVSSDEFNSVPVNRYLELQTGGIPPEPYTIVPEGSETVDVYVGNEKELELTPSLDRVFWYSE